MAYKKNRKTLKRRVRRRVRRRMVRRKPRVAVGPFPKERIVKMKLSTGLMTLASSGGAMATLDVYANWPYYGTRNAYGFDQWSALYNKCVVIGSKINVYQQGYTASSAQPWAAGIYLSDDTTNFTDYQVLVEANRGRFMRSTPYPGTFRKVSNWFSAKKFFNVKDVKDNMDRLGNGVSTTVPGDSAIFKVWAQPLDKAATDTIYVHGIIEYICLFSEPKDVPT